MADPVLRITHGDDSFDLRGLTAQEMAKVKTETGFRNRQEFFDAITDEDPAAILAAFLLARIRKGEKPRWDDIDVNLDDVIAGFYDDTGRQVEPVIQTDDDGRPVLRDGVPVGERDEQGNLKWRYVDSGDPVPPTGSAETTSSPDTTPKPGESSASGSGIPTTVAS